MAAQKNFVDTFNRLWQNHSVFPSILKKRVRIYHNFAKGQVLYLDATDTVISLKGTDYDYESNTSLYYTLVVRTSKERLATCCCGSTEHSLMAISHFLEDFH